MDPIILDLSSDNPVHEMTSICMECYKDGSTRLMLTKIPYFKEVIISSFLCDHCGNSNNSVQPASTICDHGVRYTLLVRSVNDLDRQVIKSEYATIKVPVLELDIPPESQKGSSSTIEGFLSKTKDGILAQQSARRELYPELATKLDSFVAKLDNIMLVQTPFTFIIEDPSGNSFIENPLAPNVDTHLKFENYTRSKDDEDMLGITDVREANAEEEEEEKITPVTQNEHTEVITFEAMCNACSRPAVCNMKEVNIPFFKTILLMANVCDHCGYKDSEIKMAGGIAEHGQKIILTMTDSEMDLNRDILKAETAKMEIPELGLSMSSGSLGGRFTTIEGLLVQMKDQLKSINPFSFGDSSNDENHQEQMKKLIDGLDEILQNERLVEIIVEDPAGNSYVQNVYAPDNDPNLKIIEFTRTAEDDDELGIKDMKTENYEENG